MASSDTFVPQTAGLVTLLHFVDTDRMSPRVVVIRVEACAEMQEDEVFEALKASVRYWCQNSGEGKEALFNSDGALSINRLIEGDLDTPAFRRAIGRHKLTRVEVISCFALMSCRDATAPLTSD